MYSIHSCFRLRRWFWLHATRTIRRALITPLRPQPERREYRARRVPQPRRIQDHRVLRGNQAHREHRVQAAAVAARVAQVERRAEQHQHLNR